MRIVLGADQYPEYINGAATFTARLAAGLARSGHTVDLVWPAADGRRSTDLEAGVRVHRIRSVRLPGRPRMQVCTPRGATGPVEQILQIARPDVVHVQSHLGLGRTLLRQAQAAGVPVVATNHFMPENLVHHVPLVRRFPEQAARLAWRDLERVYAGADLVTTPTQRAAELLAAATGLPAAEVISCGVDVDGDTGTPGPGSDQSPTVLFVGRLEQEKNVDELLDAFALLEPTWGARLEIIGMGSRRAALEARSRASGLQDRVSFLGAVSDADLQAAYRRCDVFVMPGTAELQSLATLEAMAAGRPVVAADAMALPHLVHHGENGYLYAPGSASGLAGHLSRLLGDPALCVDLGRESRRIAQQHSLGATVALFTTGYAEVVARAGARCARPVAVLG